MILHGISYISDKNSFNPRTLHECDRRDARLPSGEKRFNPRIHVGCDARDADHHGCVPTVSIRVPM